MEDRYRLRLASASDGWYWKIIYGKHGSTTDRTVWSRRMAWNEDCGEYEWPADMRAEYERLTGKPEFSAQSLTPNIVEFLENFHFRDSTDDAACHFDQPCRFGNRIVDHAVYCHNDGWLYAPRKCRRSPREGDDHCQQRCPGFAPNPRPAPS